MKIALIDVDSKIANLALMKISAYHKAKGDEVSWYSIFDEFDIVYMSKVFTFTPDFDQCITNAKKIIKGGTGYDIHTSLPAEIDRLQPDYSIYPKWDKKTSLGFLTRGCPNKCNWCIVPHKEGAIVPYMDIEEVTQGYRLKKAVLMDNNILGLKDYAVDQFNKIIEHGIRVDFNQAMDARLVDHNTAKLLANMKWINNTIRFGCDTAQQVGHCERVIFQLRHHGFNGFVELYTLIHGDFAECFERINKWRDWKYVVCQAQPKLNLNGKTIIPQWQKDLAKWANRRWFYTACEFKDFEVRKGFKCKAYFEQTNTKQ